MFHCKAWKEAQSAWHAWQFRCWPDWMSSSLPKQQTHSRTRNRQTTCCLNVVSLQNYHQADLNKVALRPSFAQRHNVNDFGIFALRPICNPSLVPSSALCRQLAPEHHRVTKRVGGRLSCWRFHQPAVKWLLDAPFKAWLFRVWPLILTDSCSTLISEDLRIILHHPSN